MKFILANLLLLASCVSASASLPTAPVIGVFSQPYNKTHDMIAASYIKYVESGGGRPLRIPYNTDNQTMDLIHSQINGVLFPGGGVSLSDGARYMWNKITNDMNSENGEIMPIWGTCLGFEWLLQLQSEDNGSIDEKFNAENMTVPLEFTKAAQDSRLFAPIETSYSSVDKLELMGSFPVTMNNHGHGITPDTFNSYDKLTSFYNVLATNGDEDGKEFVSVIEAKNFPIYGTQWHPEKNAFEYGVTNGDIPYQAIDHSPEGVLTSFLMSTFFIEECKKYNKHEYKGADVYPLANLEVIDVQNTEPSFEEKYMFLSEDDSFERLGVKLEKMKMKATQTLTLGEGGDFTRN